MTYFVSTHVALAVRIQKKHVSWRPLFGHLLLLLLSRAVEEKLGADVCMTCIGLRLGGHVEREVNQGALAKIKLCISPHVLNNRNFDDIVEFRQIQSPPSVE